MAISSGDEDAVPPGPCATTELPAPVVPFAAKAEDLESLRDAVVDAAGIGGGLWFSYLFVLFYLAIAVGGVKHLDLLFENPVKLPFLNVDLPLIGFFVLGPLLILIVHTYVLLHFVLLAGKIRAFHIELQAQIPDEEIRVCLRRQLPSYIFVQSVAGPREVRTGPVGFMLRLIGQVSLVIGPLALLILFQLQFLPYHHEPITWWQRIAVVADVAILLMLWPSVARGETADVGWDGLWQSKRAALASLAPVLFVFTVVTFPGEWLEANLPSIPFVPRNWPTAKWEDPKIQSGENGNTGRKASGSGEVDVRVRGAWVSGVLVRTYHVVQSMGWTTLHKLLLAGEVDRVARKPTSVWSNRLVLPDVDVVDHTKIDSEAKIAALRETVSLRGRRLEGAVLLGAHLRKADFTGAQLQDAALGEADLREAKFECAFKKENDQGVRSQQCVQLQGASLAGAQLQGASLVGAQLQGASFRGAHLQGASLWEAQLQGASLDSAELQGADLSHAQLQGATLSGAQLQGAALNNAMLQGVDAEYSNLQGAELVVGQLQGVSLKYAHIQDTEFDGVLVWRTNLPREGGEFAMVRSPITEAKYICPPDLRPRQGPFCDWSNSSFAALRRLIEERVPKGAYRSSALDRIARLDPSKSWGEESSAARRWLELSERSTLDGDYDKRLAARLRKVGCSSGGRYVIHGLLSQLVASMQDGPRQPGMLAVEFLDEAHCPGARGLSEEDKDKLRDSQLLLQEMRDRRQEMRSLHKRD